MKGIYLGAYKALHEGHVIKYDDMKTLEHQGGFNVHQVIEKFIETIEEGEKNV